MSKLTSMMNIGKEMSKKLISIGIDSPEKLIEIDRGVPSSLSGVFIHTGRRDPEHRIQLPSGRPEKGTESVQRPAQEEILNGYRFPP